jgi:hypothetical protein
MLLSVYCYSIYKRIRITFPVFYYSSAALSFSLFPPSGYFILLSNAHSFAAVLSYILIYSLFIFLLFREQANSKHAFLSHHPFPLSPRPCGIFTYAQEEGSFQHFSSSSYSNCLCRRRSYQHFQGHCSRRRERSQGLHLQRNLHFRWNSRKC